MIWLVGDKGMLGSEVARALSAAGLEHAGSDRDVDILDPAALRAFAAGKSLSWIVNCAAYTAVDKAEDEPELARSINAGGPKNLAGLAAAIGARILHISTDYVFDGTGSRPYLEDDPVAPTGVYGQTKAEGEDLVRRSCAEHVILRTAWLYGVEGNNFVRTMLRLMGSKERIGVVADQRGTPTYAVDLARAIASIVAGGSPVFGTFHYTNLGEASWYEFALEIQKQGRERGILARDCAVDALTTDQYPSKVKRPAYSVLSKEKVRRAYDPAIPDWKDALSRFFLELAP